MKKKYFIIPIVAIVLAVLTGLFISLFTTPVLAYITENNNKGYHVVYHDDGSETYEYDDWFYTVKKVGKIAQFAYKLNPSQENLETLAGLYNPNFYISGTYKGNTPPSDFLKNSVKYSKLMVESKFSPGESTYAVSVDSGERIFLTGNRVKYAMALYLDGQIEESKKEILDLTSKIDNAFKKDGIDTFNSYLGLRDYFYLVYSTTENPTLKKWVLDTEKEIEQKARKNEKLNGYISRNGYMFSNPDFESYATFNWPENKNSKYNNYFSEVREFEETPTTLHNYSTDYESSELLYSGKQILNGAYIKNWEITYKGLEGFDEVVDDRLYVVSEEKETNKQRIELFMDEEVHSFNLSDPNNGLFEITNGGVYTIINRNEIVLYNENAGELTHIYKSEDGEIKSLLVKKDLLWFLCGDKIYRVYLPSNNVDLICENVDFDNFHCFLEPISNFEIEWLEIHPKDSKRPFVWERAYYYNSTRGYVMIKDYVPDSQPQEIIYPERKWWLEGDAHFIQSEIIANVTYDGDLKEKYNSRESYCCTPFLERSESTSEEDSARIEEIHESIRLYVDSFYEHGIDNPDYRYFIESKYENKNGKTVITIKGMVTKNLNTGELEPISKELIFDYVLTDCIVNLNSSQTNFLNQSD